MPRISPVPILIALALLCACGDDHVTPEGPPPNIVLVCIDTLRADHTSLYGYERETTPNLDRIAAEGLFLKHHFANASWTKPSVASILTGLHPSAHGSREGSFSKKNRDGQQPASVDRLDDGHVTLPEALAEGGYRTLAHVTNYNMLERFGYAQGYDEYRFVEYATALEKVNRSDRLAMQSAVDALTYSKEPVFVWVHIMSVHQYVAPEAQRVFQSTTRTEVNSEAPGHGRMRDYEVIEDAIDDYDASILYVDSLLGELFEFVREKAPHTVLAITSDHGEEFYEHGGFEHGTSLYNELLGVPCVLWGPGVPQGVVEGVTDSIDLYPTLLTLGHLDPSGRGLPGRSVIEGGQATSGKLASFGEQHHRGTHRRFSLVRDGKKFIDARHKRRSERDFRELWADGLSIEREPLEADPADLGEWAAEVELLRRAAETFHAQVVGDTEREALDDADLEALRALGYTDDDE